MRLRPAPAAGFVPCRLHHVWSRRVASAAVSPSGTVPPPVPPPPVPPRSRVSTTFMGGIGWHRVTSVPGWHRAFPLLGEALPVPPSRSRKVSAHYRSTLTVLHLVACRIGPSKIPTPPSPGSHASSEIAACTLAPTRAPGRSVLRSPNSVRPTVPRWGKRSAFGPAAPSAEAFRRSTARLRSALPRSTLAAPRRRRPSSVPR